MYKLVDLFPYYDPKKEPTPERVFVHLRDIAYILLDYQFDRATMQFSALMKGVSSMTGVKNDFFGCCGAIKELNDLFYKHTGHLIGACVVTRHGSINESFFEKAMEVGELDEDASPAEREKFWTGEQEFFQRKSWGQLLDMLDDIFGE